MSGGLDMQDLKRLWERAGRPSTAEDFMELWEKFATKAASQADAQSEQSRSLSLPVDFEELEDVYVYTADVPGLERADLKVRVNGERELTISGERKRSQSGTSTSGDDSSTDSERRRRSKFERRFGRFSRTVTLAKDADIKGIRAAVEQGVLTLTVCKLEQDPNVTEIPIY